MDNNKNNIHDALKNALNNRAYRVIIELPPIPKGKEIRHYQGRYISFEDHSKILEKNRLEFNEHEAAMVSKMLEMEKKYNDKINDLTNQISGKNQSINVLNMKIDDLHKVISRLGNQEYGADKINELKEELEKQNHALYTQADNYQIKLNEMEKKYNEKINDLTNQVLHQIEETKKAELHSIKISEEYTEKLKKLEHELHLKSSENDSLNKQLNKLIEENKHINEKTCNGPINHDVHLKIYNKELQDKIIELKEKLKTFDAISEKMKAQMPGFDWIEAILNGYISKSWSVDHRKHCVVLIP